MHVTRQNSLSLKLCTRWPLGAHSRTLPCPWLFPFFYWWPPSPASASVLQGPNLGIPVSLPLFPAYISLMKFRPHINSLELNKMVPTLTSSLTSPFSKCDVYPALHVSVNRHQARNLLMNPDPSVGHLIWPMTSLGASLWCPILSLQCPGLVICSCHSSWPLQKASHWSSRF